MCLFVRATGLASCEAWLVFAWVRDGGDGMVVVKQSWDLARGVAWLVGV